MQINLNEITEQEDFLVFNKEAILKSLDPNKETILAFTYRYRMYDKNCNINGAMTVTLKTLEEKFNVIYIGYDYDISVFPETIHIKQSAYIKFKDKFLTRKKDFVGENYFVANHKVIYEYIKSKLSWIKNIKYIVGIASDRNWYLQNQVHTVAGKYGYKMNEFHDYSGADATIIKELKGINQKVVDNYVYYCNPLAFMQYSSAIFYELLKFLVDNNKDSLKSVDAIIFDPIIFSPILDALPVNNRNFYFENDNRGVRNFIKYPIAELQHLVFDLQYDKFVVNKKESANHTNEIDSLFDEKPAPEIKPHSKLFFYMGLILMNKGSRLELWSKYLKNLRLENSDLYIPPVKNKLIASKEKSSDKLIKRNQNLMTDNIYKVLKEIESHPMYNGYILPIEINDTIIKYRYSLILRCVSICDSLNFRPLLYTYYKILPFLDPEYDPSYLQIPKEIQDKLIVNDSTDIENKIQYYEEHPEEREEILNKLWNHFEIDKWLRPDYYKKQILSYYE